MRITDAGGQKKRSQEESSVNGGINIWPEKTRYPPPTTSSPPRKNLCPRAPRPHTSPPPTTTTTSSLPPLLKPRPTFPTIPPLRLPRRLPQPRTPQMKPLTRTTLVIASDHFAITTPIAVAVFRFVGVVGVVFGVGVVVYVFCQV